MTININKTKNFVALMGLGLLLAGVAGLGPAFPGSRFGIRLPGGVHAQSTASVNIDLGVVVESVSAGAKVRLPVNLVATEDVQVGKISLTVSFPAKELSFVEAVRGPVAESADGQIESRLSDGESGEKILEVDVTASKPMSQGGILDLMFEISEHGRLGDEIKVKNLRRSVQSMEGKPIDAYGIDGSITALSAITPCFFYMH